MILVVFGYLIIGPIILSIGISQTLNINLLCERDVCEDPNYPNLLRCLSTTCDTACFPNQNLTSWIPCTQQVDTDCVSKLSSSNKGLVIAGAIGSSLWVIICCVILINYIMYKCQRHCNITRASDASISMASEKV